MQVTQSIGAGKALRKPGLDPTRWLGITLLQAACPRRPLGTLDLSLWASDTYNRTPVEQTWARTAESVGLPVDARTDYLTTGRVEPVIHQSLTVSSSTQRVASSMKRSALRKMMIRERGCTSASLARTVAIDPVGSTLARGRTQRLAQSKVRSVSSAASRA